jgi:hypothetical protein
MDRYNLPLESHETVSMKKLENLHLMAAGLTVLYAVSNAGLAADDNDRASTGSAYRTLHIEQTVTTSQTGFPQSLFMYDLLQGAKSTGEVRALQGTISIANHGAEFSEVLWVLNYWTDQCPADDQSLAGSTTIWTEIQKNPSKSEQVLAVDLTFPNPVPITGCIGFVSNTGHRIRPPTWW